MRLVVVVFLFTAEPVSPAAFPPTAFSTMAGTFSDFQTSYRFWFVDNAFFGEGYEFTAVGAVSHLYEPSTGGVNDSYNYFGLWERGKSLAICAWRSRGTHAFQTIGDPFVLK
jgi:hypothetical protein